MSSEACDAPQQPAVKGYRQLTFSNEIIEPVPSKKATHAQGLTTLVKQRIEETRTLHDKIFGKDSGYFDDEEMLLIGLTHYQNWMLLKGKEPCKELNDVGGCMVGESCNRKTEEARLVKGCRVPVSKPVKKPRKEKAPAKPPQDPEALSPCTGPQVEGACEKCGDADSCTNPELIACRDSGRCIEEADHNACFCAPCIMWQGCPLQVHPESEECLARRKTSPAPEEEKTKTPKKAKKSRKKKDEETIPEKIQNPPECCTEPCDFHNRCRHRYPTENCKEEIGAELRRTKDTPEWFAALTEAKRKNNPGWLWEVWKIDPARGEWLYEGTDTQEAAEALKAQIDETRPEGSKVKFTVRQRPGPDYTLDDIGPCNTCQIECLDDNNGCQEFEEYNCKFEGEPVTERQGFEEICIISCGKAKIWDDPAKKRIKKSVYAVDAYTGPLFTSAKKYAETKFPDKWYILSDKYGLILPGEEIQNYDVSPEDIKDDPEFFDMVQQQAKANPDLAILKKITLLSGKVHQSIIERVFIGVEIVNPVQGLSQGERMKALKQLVEPAARESESSTCSFKTISEMHSSPDKKVPQVMHIALNPLNDKVFINSRTLKGVKKSDPPRLACEALGISCANCEAYVVSVEKPEKTQAPAPTSTAFMDEVTKTARKSKRPEGAGTGGGPQPYTQHCCGTCGHHKGRKTFHDSCPRIGELLFKKGTKSAKVLMEETQRENCGHWIVKPKEKQECETP